MQKMSFEIRIPCCFFVKNQKKTAVPVMKGTAVVIKSNVVGLF